MALLSNGHGLRWGLGLYFKTSVGNNMKFSDLDQRMRVFENLQDQFILPGIFMVARIDGRCFTRLTKEVLKFEAPYDQQFRDYMVETVKHLMNCGFKVLYGYTQSDEISLLFHPKEEVFQRKMRKFNSVLAGEASANFSLLIGDIGVFDCRISQLTSQELVVDYFRWRSEDAHRNALNSHCYWILRKKGKSPNAAHDFLEGMSVGDKNEFLFQNGMNFNDIPNWQKRGIGVYWEPYEKNGFNPLTKQKVQTSRSRITVNMELPMKDEYDKLIKKFI